ncbi:putative hydroxyacyl-thioester dehydratase-like protein [Rosellinia necatrix]|uniref:Putative hydroxyacyl-thioester dehydratase-like protein n=1 Tax=Rosellinia necatrix TaxID=77044 RepID=A0A1W2TEI2_ROSNE|nr:putative hydroxyacyl-thioester dehydratase-like protein [Rosellinia necatrix]
MRGGLTRLNRRLTRPLRNDLIRWQTPRLPSSPAAWRRPYSTPTLPVAPNPDAPNPDRDLGAEGPDITDKLPDIGAIRAEMLARPPQLHHDVMSPMNSRLLDTVLSDCLQQGEHGIRQLRAMPRSGDHRTPAFPDLDKPRAIPPGHHLVYFPLAARLSELSADGADAYHSPPRGTPFTRRVWAGGSVRGVQGLPLDLRPAVCLERVADVRLRGGPGSEKIHVDVLREYVTAADFRARFDEGGMRLRPRDGDSAGPSRHALTGLTEVRTLVFMRELSHAEKRIQVDGKQKIIRHTKIPDFSVVVTPSSSLLFHYSALSYNAHRIHLDRSYCREVEGHPDLLVHGPLTLTLMLTLLWQQQPEPRRGHQVYIDSVEYSNLAPLYTGQPMRICLARQKTQANAGSTGPKEQELGGKKWDIWIENEKGGLCVKGTAETVEARMLDEPPSRDCRV